MVELLSKVPMHTECMECKVNLTDLTAVEHSVIAVCKDSYVVYACGFD